MVLSLKEMLVIDLEATCWEDRRPAGQTPEIIEIGLCRLDLETLQPHEKTSILVRPEQSEISPFCTELTSITPDMVAKDGIPFAEACSRLRKRFGAKTKPWASYGNYDRLQFERQCSQTEIPLPLSPTHLNIKTMVALHLQLPREVGMKAALQMLKIPLEGRHHRGDDDAWNTAKIAARLLATLQKTQTP
ncbi:3'-5' exonuclease [Acanthopleuribacter pedis]|uniref:Exonuclease domain-containing protein n=1 Tax=Acanthopleuribacter pedis TaxID=442870 RepID=A0A8J7U3N8_9BACT|nr:3'-5' exonuclease [Acanthopleuribacter pedis]MBO1318959.1 exonuclease domain-containing protein [Acanthopleuribacter pedis]